MKVDGRELDPLEVEKALEALMHAEHIKQTPALHKAAIELADKKKGAIDSIAKLKKKYAEKVDPYKDEPRGNVKMGVKKVKDSDEESKIKPSTSDDELEKRMQNEEM